MEEYNISWLDIHSINHTKLLVFGNKTFIKGQDKYVRDE